ncbi:ricin-type beta-trefoil lectin domain protein [Streptomyces sp. NPDC049879]|uniref:ricin-type beta-trefoil lectin domain protein n=1 Tax=Streptomyces sp. NPDC049879 TaxID=3365598 RepID=UPI003796BBD5
MKKLLTAVVALAAAILGLTLGTAAPAVAADPPAAAAPTPLRLMPLGNSITDGVGSSTGNGYRAPLWDALAADGHALDFVGTARAGNMADPDNEGHSGWRINQIASIIDASLARYRPNVVTLEIGTNDLNNNDDPAGAPARLSALIDQIVRGAPDATVIVASLVVSTSPTLETYRAAFNQQIPGIVAAKQQAGHHVRYVDMSSLTTADLADALHPNDSGYRKMATVFQGGIRAAEAAGWLQPPVATGGQVRSALAGKCMDVNAASSANGTRVQLWSCNTSTAQWWTLRSDGTLRAVGKCLDANAHGTANGTQLQLWDCTGGANQVWQVYNGGYRNPISGRCVDVPGSTTVDGTQLQLYDCNGTNAQRWTSLPVAA